MVEAFSGACLRTTPMISQLQFLLAQRGSIQPQQLFD
jgi:hypothetical protein